MLFNFTAFTAFIAIFVAILPFLLSELRLKNEVWNPHVGAPAYFLAHALTHGQLVRQAVQIRDRQPQEVIVNHLPTVRQAFRLQTHIIIDDERQLDEVQLLHRLTLHTYIDNPHRQDPNLNVISLEIRNQRVTSAILEFIAYHFPNLKVLVLEGLPLTSDDLKVIALNFKELTELVLYGRNNSFDSNSLKEVAKNLKILTKLVLCGNHNLFDSDSLIEIAQNLEELTELLLCGHNNLFDSESLKEVAQHLNKLTALTLQGNHNSFDSESLKEVAQHLNKLTELVLYGDDNLFDSESLKKVAQNLTKLTLLALHGTDNLFDLDSFKEVALNLNELIRCELCYINDHCFLFRDLTKLRRTLSIP
jgi:hypothetical protein